MNNTADALLAGILAEPADDVVRLVYADWLMESGYHDRGEFIRVQVELAPMEAALAAFKAGQTKLWFGSEYLDRLRQRERALLGNDFCRWGVRIEGFTSVMRRGFVALVRCPCAAWLEHGPAVVRAHPLERVELTDKKPLATRAPIGGKVGYSWWHFVRDDLPHWLPRPIFLHLGGAAFDTEQDAHAALSAACLRWAHEKNALVIHNTREYTGFTYTRPKAVPP